MARDEAGLSLIEVVVGGAVATIVLLAVLTVTRQTIDSAARADARIRAAAVVDRLVERLTAEAASSWAVFVPPADVLGAANADGHEVDFFSEDGSHRPYAWAYRYDAASKHLTRYSYAPGVAAGASDDLGAFASFAATATEVNATGDPLFAHATAPLVHYSYAAMNGAVGGNAIVAVHFSNAASDRTALLASATAPTTFTFVITYTPAPPPAATPTPTPLPTW
jgi:hypothetical protein